MKKPTIFSVDVAIGYLIKPATEVIDVLRFSLEYRQKGGNGDDKFGITKRTIISDNRIVTIEDANHFVLEEETEDKLNLVKSFCTESDNKCNRMFEKLRRSDQPGLAFFVSITTKPSEYGLPPRESKRLVIKGPVPTDLKRPKEETLKR